MSRFKKETIRKLKLAGWHPNRRVNINEILLSLNTIEYCINETMQEFLQEFSGISLIYSNGEEPFSFIYRYSNISLDTVSMINNSVGELSIPIGFSYNGEFIVAITESNQVFAICEGYNQTYQIGHYFDEGVEFLCQYGLNSKKYFCK